jgi:DNA invertase Pin-like site-specific DNA recombinase
MPPRKRVDLPEYVREVVLLDVERSYRKSLESNEEAKIRIYLATEQGLTTRELADQLDIGQTSVSKYAREGKEAYELRDQKKRSRRTGEGPDGPSERTEIG